MKKFLTATLVALTICTCTQALAQMPVIPAAPAAFPVAAPPFWASNNQQLQAQMAFSEGNRISFTAYGKHAAMYGYILSQIALQENGNQQMRRIAHEERQAVRRPPVVNNITLDLGTECGYRCDDGHYMPVYRAWSYQRRSWLYRSRSSTGRVYSYYGTAPGMTWGRGFGPGY